jgi:hypothetical protein
MQSIRRGRFSVQAAIVAGVVLVIGLLAALPLWADLLKNADLKDGLSCWQGDGDSTYLKPDGTEGTQDDPGAIPVLKLVLSHGSSHMISQEIDAPGKLVHLAVSVDVYASADFKRSPFPNDYSGGADWKPGLATYYGSPIVPNVDFWIRGNLNPGIFYKLVNLKPRAWVSVSGDIQNDPINNFVVNFCVPPGEGTVYLKNPSVNP